MVGKDFEVGDLVWAQMKSYPPWPSKIAQPPAGAKAQSKKAQHWVYFFGSNNYSWIPDDKIFPHGEEMLQKALKIKSAVFHKAVEEIVSESKVLRKKIVQEKNNANSNEIAVSTEDKNKASKVKKSENKILKKKVFIEKSRLKKKALIEKNKKTGMSKHSVETSQIENDSASCSTLGLQDKLSFEVSVDTNKRKVVGSLCEEGLINSYHTKNPTGMLKDRKYISRPPTPPLDMNTVKQSLKAKLVKPTSKKIGFLGLGAIGRGIVKNLLDSGHNVTVWNRTPDKCDAFVKAGAHRGQTPADVIQACDITFCCISDPLAVKTLVFGNCGVLKGFEGCEPGKKGYVELTGIDPQTSREIAKEIFNKGGRYLEAPIHGSRHLAENGQLLVIAAGDHVLFQACESCFFAFSRHTFYVSLDVGHASKLSLIISMFHGSVTGALAESLTLVQRCKLSMDNFMEILAVGPCRSPLVKDKGKAMREGNFTSNTAIKHQQKDLGLAITLGDSVNQPLKISAAANEIFKRAKLLRYSDHDVSAVIQGTLY